MDWSNSVSGAISGGFGLLGSYLKYKYENALMDKQNQFSIDMWKMQNEYNSPSAQMQRYQEAGLNPALMYGQVSPGNATSAPAQHVPNAPDFRELRELGKAFNIEGLKQAIADTKLKQANAKSAEIDAERNRQQFRAEHNVGLNWTLDPNTGMFVHRPLGGPDERIIVDPASFYVNKILADNFRTNSLLLPRRNLIGTQAALNIDRGVYTQMQHDYMYERQKLLAPQLRMLDYQAKHFPATFWIGTAARGAQAVSPFIPIIF